MTLPTNYTDGQTIHGSDLNSWTTAINTTTNLRPGMLAPCQGSLNGETVTISGGSITTITGLTTNGYTPSIGDRILVFCAPAATGASTGFTATLEPANGIYVVTGNTTNLTVARSADMSGSVNPSGLCVLVEHATWPSNGCVFWVTTPYSAAAFTYGSGNIQWFQAGGPSNNFAQISMGTGNPFLYAYNGSGETSLSAAASVGTQALTLPATATSDTLVGRNSTDTMANKTLMTPVLNGTATGTGVSSTPAGSTIAQWDTNSNLTANAFIEQVTAITTANGTTTLTIASDAIQYVTGTAGNNQTVVLPTTGVVAGTKYRIINNSLGVVTVEASAGATVVAMASNTDCAFTALAATPTTPVGWEAQYGGTTVTVNAAGTLTLNGGNQCYVFSGTTATWTLPPFAGNAGSNLILENRGSGNVTVNAASGDHIYFNTSVTTMTIAPGGSLPLINDGVLYWNAISLDLVNNAVGILGTNNGGTGQSGLTAPSVSAGVIDTEQFITLTSAYTLTNTTSAQKLFNATTSGALTLPVGSYFFETTFLLSSLGTGAISFGFGGTATLSGVLWYGQTLRATTTLNTGTAATTLSLMMSTSGAATSLQSSPPATSANAWSVIKGKLRVSVAGTIIPQITLAATAAAAIVGVDSHFRIWNVGSNTVTNVGAWT